MANRRPALLFLTAFLLGTLAFSTRADAFVYWSASGPFSVNSILRANLDGSGAGVVEFDGERSEYVFIVGENPCGAAVDGAHFYWSDGGDDSPSSIRRANLDGSGVDESFIAATAGCGVAVDGAHVYWTDGQGSIGRANLDGTGVEPGFITAAGNLCGVAVDGAHVYWTSQPNADDPFQPGRIGRANLDGSGVEQSFVTADGIPCGVAVDGAHVYWTNRQDAGDAIGRANLDGSSIEQNFITGTDGPCGVAVDGSYVYWTNRGGSPGAATRGSVGRANLDGSGVNQSFIAEGGGSPCEITVDALTGSGGSTGGELSLGKVKRNEKRGTAKLTVDVPGPGELELASTTKVKGADARIEEPGEVKLPVKPRGSAKRKLNEKGKAKVKVKVTYTPEFDEPDTEAKKVKLVKK